MSASRPEGSRPLLFMALALTVGVATWGIVDPEGLGRVTAEGTQRAFRSRGWFVMLTASLLLLSALALILFRSLGSASSAQLRSTSAEVGRSMSTSSAKT